MSIGAGSKPANFDIGVGSLSAAGAWTTTAGGIVGSTAGDNANPGFFGGLPGAAATAITPALVSTTSTGGTTADIATIRNFTPGIGITADIVNFAGGEWKPGGALLGLTHADATTVIPTGAATNAVFSSGYGAGATIASTDTVIALTPATTFAGASDLATSLGATFNLTFGGAGLAAGKDAHILFMYTDTGGNTRIADVDFHNTSAAAEATTTAVARGGNILASDLVQLVGVPESSVNAANLHFV